jgi:hypothetical protein
VPLAPHNRGAQHLALAPGGHGRVDPGARAEPALGDLQVRHSREKRVSQNIL